MSASQEQSVGKGRASQPVAGGVRPQILLSITIGRVMSKFLDETEDFTTGYGLSHCKRFNTFFFLSDCNLGSAGGVANTVSRPPGG